MNNKKIDQYKLTASIHTLSVKSPGLVVNILPEVSDCIKVSSRDKNGSTTTTSIINVNKLAGDVFSYSEFERAFNTILEGAGIDDYTIIRADMRFDSYDKKHYKEFAKLHRYLISALAVTYKVNNTYRSTDLFTQQQLSVAIKNRYFEIENYDKHAESGGTDAAESRLEERSKSGRSWADNDLKKEFKDRWFTRWEKAFNNLDLVHKTYNDVLEEIYKTGESSDTMKFRSLTDFLIQYQDCIFCKEQMVDLLSRFPEVVNPVNRAENHKKRYGIEYFSKNDVRRAIGEIKRSTLEFFEK